MYNIRYYSVNRASQTEESLLEACHGQTDLSPNLKNEINSEKERSNNANLRNWMKIQQNVVKDAPSEKEPLQIPVPKSLAIESKEKDEEKDKKNKWDKVKKFIAGGDLTGFTEETQDEQDKPTDMFEGQNFQNLRGVLKTLTDSIISLDATIKSNDLRALSTDNTDQTESSYLKKETKSGPKQRRDIKKNQKTDVFIRITFVKIGEIDTMKESFTTEVMIQARWREPRFDNKPALNPTEIRWSEYWSPHLYLVNTLGDPRPKTWHDIRLKNGEAYVYQTMRVNGTFIETMELDQFPFDSQDLTVTIGADKCHAEVELIEDHEDPCSISIQSFVDEQEWSLHHHVSVTSTLIEKTEMNSTSRVPTFSVSGKVRRRPGFYVWNVLVVMFLICILAFGTFSVSLALPQNRMQLGFTLVLTSIAFKFVANQNMPKISYLTYLDKYILMSMCLLAVICIWHAFVAHLEHLIEEVNVKEVDRYAMFGAASIFILFHAVFLLLIYCVWVRREVMYTMKDKEHKQMIEAIRMKTARKKHLMNKVAAAPLLLSVIKQATAANNGSGFKPKLHTQDSRASLDFSLA